MAPNFDVGLVLLAPGAPLVKNDGGGPAGRGPVSCKHV